VTRLYTTMSAEEMTLDPVFGFDGTRPAVSNVRDLSQYEGLYSCERDESISVSFAASDALEPFTESGQVRPAPDETAAVSGGVNIAAIAIILLVVGVIVALFMRVFLKE
jgi:hypothetical protein